MGDLRTQILAILRAVWRRRWIIAGIAWGLCLVGWFVVLNMPDRYQSRTRIYVDTQTMLAPLLRGLTVAPNLNQQVAFMKRTLLSRPNMLEIIRMTDLDLTVENEAEMDALIQSVAERISIRSQGRDLFTIAYESEDPKLAQRVVQSLVNIFVENNLGENRSDMEKARAFLEAQLAVYERQLQEAERRLADFKASNLEFGRGAGGYVGKRQNATAALERAEAEYQDAIALRDQLREQIATVPQYLEVDAAPQVIFNNGQAANSPLAELERRIQDTERQIVLLLGRYTDAHPDVIAARRQIEYLNQQLADEEERLLAAAEGEGDELDAGGAKTKVPNALYEHIKLRLVDAESQVTTRERQLKRSREERDYYEKMATTAPLVEARLAGLNRDYSVIKKNYEQLLARRESAKIAQAVDAETDIQFRIVDPPEVPTIPVGPNRPFFMTVVLAAGLGAGIAFAYLLSQMDVSFHNAASLRDTFGLPVLGAVSAIVSNSSRRRQHAGLAGFAVACTCLLLVFGGLIVFETPVRQNMFQIEFAQLL